MNMRQKIWALPITAILIFVIGSGLNWSFSNSSSAHLRSVMQVEYPFLARAEQLNAELTDIQDNLKSAVAASDKGGLDRLAERAKVFEATLGEMARIEGKAPQAEQIGREFKTYVDAAQGAASIMLGAKEGDPAPLLQTMQQAQEKLSAHLETTRQEAKAGLEGNVSSTIAMVERGLLVNLAVAVAVVIVLAVISHLVITSVVRQIGGEPEYAVQIVHGVAQGDLSVPIALRPQDNYSLLYAMKCMQQELSGTVAGIRGAIDSVRTATQNVVSGNELLEERTQAQSSRLVEAAGSMERLTATVQQNASSALEASQNSNTASEVARRGGDVMQEVVRTMDSIHTSSRKVEDIVSVIDGIAFQTNILALNAAVEAARAGEQGRGFAVVAAEVRSLAQRSATAAHEIKALIGDSAARIESGTQLVQSAGQTMGEILDAVGKVTALGGEIASATTEQSQGIAQINTSIAALESATQQNTELVRDAASATQALEKLAEQLASTVSVFKLDSATA